LENAKVPLKERIQQVLGIGLAQLADRILISYLCGSLA